MNMNTTPSATWKNDWSIEFAKHELNCAIAALPGYPNTTPDQIKAAAAAGDRNALYVIEEATVGCSEEARKWFPVEETTELETAMLNAIDLRYELREFVSTLRNIN